MAPLITDKMSKGQNAWLDTVASDQSTYKKKKKKKLASSI